MASGDTLHPRLERSRVSRILGARGDHDDKRTTGTCSPWQIVLTPMPMTSRTRHSGCYSFSWPQFAAIGHAGSLTI